ncbi:hypothetical protein [Paenibacillus kribbensis]|uniref:hypothetical protein n=1 Tax=Paenibacillus kribbensis TaxID=172713 RepID=UPI000ACA2874|nr:hypothetical protein [Paenibacillus kribbensis]
MKQATDLIAAFDDCLRRNVSKERLQAFVDRARRYWNGNAEMLAVVEGLVEGVRV